MRAVEYLCLGGTEVANPNRVLAYTANVGVLSVTGDCNCPAVDDEDLVEYLSPAEDDAPWYTPSIPESADFLGLFANDIRVLSVASRPSRPVAGEGSSLGSLGLSGRIVQVTGHMFATSALGMAYGEQWLREVLSGNYWSGGCASDTLTYLPACPDDAIDYDADPYFRYLYRVGLIDRPSFDPIGLVGEAEVQTVSFQLEAGVPWIYGPTLSCLDEVEVGSGDTECCLVTAGEWSGAVGTSITLSAPDGDIDDITLTAQLTDGTCPETGGMPVWKIDIPILREEEILVIDGIRRDVSVYNPSSKRYEGALSLLEPDGLFDFLDVPPCGQMCICISRAVGGNTLLASIDYADRNL